MLVLIICGPLSGYCEGEAAKPLSDDTNTTEDAGNGAGGEIAPLVCSTLEKNGSVKSLSAAELKDYVRQVQQQYSSTKFLTAEFSQLSYLRSLDLSEASSGSVWFHNPGQLRWEYSLPEKQVFLVRDQEFELYQPIENQVIQQNLEEYFSSDIPVAFLLGLGELEESFIPESGCITSSEIVLVLRPRTEANDPRKVKELRMSVGAQSKFPTTVQVIDREENVTQIEFKSPDRTTPIQKDIFVLALPAGVDRQDLRKLH
ncbi:MAG: outer membrane lipoprotein carrier protein LolA [Bdellovibrionales bacterium]|nr:outer membrane lipoprotein carrier protein LolA [Bdellovibrionales bacterium]